MSLFKFYADIYQGVDPSQFGITATTKPHSAPSSSAKRVSFTVDIPDDLLYLVDHDVKEVIGLDDN